jgi:phosphatidate cytidylyltransferase
VTRVLSGAVLVVLALAAVWLSPPVLFLLIAEALVVLACSEFASLARTGDTPFPTVLATGAAALTCASFARVAFGGGPALPLDVALATALVAAGAVSLPLWNGGRGAVALAADALLPCVYIGVPIGSMVAVREAGGPAALFLLMLTIMVSDSAQYYTGRAFGRRKLAERISPKKTVEGAIGGFLFGTLLMAIAGIWWLPAVPAPLRVLLGATVVALGIVGDLFESMLKRSAGMKDSSALIPGHGGILDRIDALLFAAPVYYVVLKYV